MPPESSWMSLNAAFIEFTKRVLCMKPVFSDELFQEFKHLFETGYLIAYALTPSHEVVGHVSRHWWRDDDGLCESFRETNLTFPLFNAKQTTSRNVLLRLRVEQFELLLDLYSNLPTGGGLPISSDADVQKFQFPRTGGLMQWYQLVMQVGKSTLPLPTAVAFLTTDGMFDVGRRFWKSNYRCFARMLIREIRLGKIRSSGISNDTKMRENFDPVFWEDVAPYFVEGPGIWAGYDPSPMDEEDEEDAGELLLALCANEEHLGICQILRPNGNHPEKSFEFPWHDIRVDYSDFAATFGPWLFDSCALENQSSLGVNLKSKTGPRPIYNWEEAREIAFGFWREYGAPDKALSGRSTRTALITLLNDYFVGNVGKEPSSSTMHASIAKFESQWRDAQRAGGRGIGDGGEN